MATIRLNDAVFERAKSYMAGRSWNDVLNDMMNQVYNSPGIPEPGAQPPVMHEQIRTNNNVPPKPPTPPVPDPLTMTFSTISDAIKVVKKLNREVGWQQYFVENDPFENVISIKRHPTLEEKAKAAIEAEKLRKISYQNYLERIGKLSQPDCASH